MIPVQRPAKSHLKAWEIVAKAGHKYTNTQHEMCILFGFKHTSSILRTYW